MYRAFALDELRADPQRVVYLALRKFWLYWGHFGGADIRYPGASSPVFWLPWLMTLPFFLLGLWMTIRRDPARFGFLYLYLLGQTAIVVTFFVLPRYRIEVLPILLMFAAEGVHRLWVRWQQPRVAT